MRTEQAQQDVGVIHGSPLIRESLSDLLDRHGAVRIIGVFESAQSLLAHQVGGSPIILYDHATCRQDGVGLLEEVRRRLPEARILLFGVMNDDQAIIECVRAGASGCVLVDASTEDLLAAIRSLADGTPPASPRVVTTLFSYISGLQGGDDRTPPETLTPREEQILQLLAKGLTNQEIARTLALQPQTVKNYVHQVLQKLNVRSRLELIRRLRSAGREVPSRHR